MKGSAWKVSFGKMNDNLESRLFSCIFLKLETIQIKIDRIDDIQDEKCLATVALTSFYDSSIQLPKAG